MDEIKNKITSTEKTIRLILSITLILIPLAITAISVPFGLVYGIILVPLLIIFVPYFVFAKYRHFGLDIVLFILGLTIYKTGGGFLLDAPWPAFKAFIMSAVFSSPTGLIGLLILIFKSLIFLGIAFILINDFLAYSRSLIDSPRRKIFTWISFLILMAIVFGLPFIRDIQIQSGPASSVGYGGSTNIVDQSFYASPQSGDKEATGILEVDQANNKWIYKLKLKNISNHSAEIIGVFDRNEMLIPPFDNVVIEQGEIIKNKIIVEKGQTVVIHYYSPKPIWIITVKESTGAEYQFSFIR